MLFNFRYTALFIITLCTLTTCISQDYCAFDPDVQDIYQHIVNLDLELATSQLGNKAETSSNKAYILLENEIDFYYLFIHEELSEFQKRKSLKTKRLKHIEQSGLSGEWKRFLRAEILLQWSLIYFKMQEDFKAFQSIRESVLILEENARLFPDFMYTYKSLGVLHTLLSTIPEDFKWAAKLLGLEGDLQTGKYELQKYIEKAEPVRDVFLNESYAAMSFVISYLENKPDQAYKYWMKKLGTTRVNALLVMLQCKLALKAGYNDAAILALQTLSHQEKQKLPYLYFLTGLTFLQKLNIRAADQFHLFLRYNKGSSYVKEAFQKLAWTSLIKSDTGMYRLYITNCLLKGRELTDEDKQAKFEAQSGQIPDVLLLKARLLSDGAYGTEAYSLLAPLKSKYYNDPEKRLECAYRLGRLSQMNKVYTSALEYYQDVLKFDPDRRSYMSSNALLQSGLISEGLFKYSDARVFFEHVLDTSPEQYKRSLHQKAKAGLARLRGIKN
jgi:hypothetical protein